MKPKFRIGDRVRIIETGEKLLVIDIGDSWREEDPFTYLLAGEVGSYDGGYTRWYPGVMLELVGCGIPAPALRWNQYAEAILFKYHFRISSFPCYKFIDSDPEKRQWRVAVDGYQIGEYESEEEAKEACQAYWQQLWDKEILISRDLPETGE